MKKTVLIGILGSVLDNIKAHKRWKRWRPTVSLFMHDALRVDRFELLYQPQFGRLRERIASDIGRVSPATAVNSHEIALSDPWDFEEVYGVLHDFARRYPFDPDAEEYLIHITTGTHVVQICLFLLTESRHFPGRLVQTSPHRQRDPRHPEGEYRIIDLDLSKYDRIAARFQQEARDDISFLKSGIETRNAGFNALIERIERVALHAVDPILLTGPTGAGKSRLARRIYELKRSRRQIAGAFVTVNCATLRGDPAMSALFGHKKGAFTGATTDREGLLRAADGGMIFLDEVGELGPDEQAMLLRAVEEKRFPPMGADVEVTSDFQLICGTNRDLAAEVAARRFREDLLARINLWTFRMPGLRERVEDIEPNLDYELDRFAGRTGNRVRFNREGRERFLAFATSPEAVWRANFRDLNGAVTRMATLAAGGRITRPVVDEEIARLKQAWTPFSRDRYESNILNASLDDVLGERAAAVDPFDRFQLEGVLRVCRESASLSEAGRRLFAVSRQSRKTVNDADRLRKYLAKFGVAWADVRPEAGKISEIL